MTPRSLSFPRRPAALPVWFLNFGFVFLLALVSLCRPSTYLFSSRPKFSSDCVLLMPVLHPLVLSSPTFNELDCSHLGSVCPSFARWNDPAPNQLQIKSLLSVNIAPLAVVFTSWPQRPSPLPLLRQAPLECPNQPTGPWLRFCQTSRAERSVLNCLRLPNFTWMSADNSF